MKRRTFTKLAMAGIAGPVIQSRGGFFPIADHRFTSWPGGVVHGVNLGGWLVLEKWITPSLFAGLKAKDEAQLCEELGNEKAASRLRSHREAFITENDFRWIAERGLNAVRIPVGYWVLQKSAPFVSAPGVLDWAFTQARRNNLGVLLDLHAAPGSQNGWDHSGRQGKIEWHTSKANIESTLRILEDLAARYRKFDNLLGIELLNEPHWTIPQNILKDFYEAAYRRLRHHAGKQVAIVIHDSFRPLAWSQFMQQPAYENVILDTHFYQVFTEEDQQRDLSGQIRVAAVDRKQQLEAMAKQLPVCVGEWSLALPEKSLKGLSAPELNTARRAFADAQLASYGSTGGWFFWTYKTERSPEWSLSESVKRGWLPAKFGGSSING
jgi:glucan 1,3-beta-glucosidase